MTTERKAGLRAAVQAKMDPWVEREAGVLWEVIDSLVDESASMQAILQEFMADVEAVGVKQTGKDWPDLLVTYNKARMLLGKIHPADTKGGKG